jgi:hypothetical protein
VTAPTLVPIGQIVVDDSLQPRCDGISEEHVDALIEAPENWPPIVLARRNGSLFLIDGFHRHEAARLLGVAELTATIFDPADDTDLFDVAFQLNAKHGRPLALRDRKAYAAAMLRDHPELPDREVGRRSGLHHETVGALRDDRQKPVPIPERKPGELRSDVGLLDPIRFGKKASTAQKAVAGYVQRLGEALHDPYSGDSTLNVWSENPAVIARACFAAMGDDRATKLLTMLETDAHFIFQVSKARTTIKEEVTR